MATGKQGIMDTIFTPEVDIDGFDDPTAGQGTWVNTSDASVYNGRYENSSSADGDNVSWDKPMQKGTYKLIFCVFKAATGGIVDFDIDTVEVASHDTYSATSDRNQVMTTANISVATSGMKTIKMRVDGKHASSSDYYCRCHYIKFIRTGD